MEQDTESQNIFLSNQKFYSELEKTKEIPNPLSGFTANLPEMLQKQVKMLFSKQSPLGNKGAMVLEKINLGVAFTQIFKDEQLKFIRESFMAGRQDLIARELVKSESALKRQGLNARDLYIKLCEYYDVKP
jgi:hypothetical protein